MLSSRLSGRGRSTAPGVAPTATHNDALGAENALTRPPARATLARPYLTLSPSPNGAPNKPRGRSLGIKKGRIIAREEFRWHGLDLHLGRRKTPVLTLVADNTYPHLFRIRYPDGWLSPPANISGAKDAAYGHGRWLLKGEAT